MSSAAAAGSPGKSALSDLFLELAGTRRVLERVPEDRFDWRPHPRSMSLGHLADHLADLPQLALVLLGYDALDLAAIPPPRTALPGSRAAVLQRFDANVAALREAFEAVDDDAMGALWTLRRGDETIARMPRAAGMRSMFVSHMIHHRAQLTVYLRLLDVPLPTLYGPTADEPSGA